MKLTTKRLKQIIAEEVQKLDEMEGPWTGETDRFAGSWYERLIAQITELMKELKSADPMNWEHNLAEIMNGVNKPRAMPEAYTRTKKRK